MQTPVLPSEEIAKEGPANCMHGVEGVGGRLYCTNQRLVFESHAFNVQTGTTIIDLDQIVAIQPTQSKVLGIPLANNSIAVQLSNGTVHTGPSRLARYT